MGIIVMGFFITGVWEFVPDNVVVINGPVTTDKTVYKQGERISYTFSYCKTKKLPGRISRTLVNSTYIVFSPIMSDLPVGCREITTSDLTIPDYADPGTYHIEGTGEYQINPLRKYYNNWQSNEFQIIK